MQNKTAKPKEPYYDIDDPTHNSFEHLCKAMDAVVKNFKPKIKKNKIKLKYLIVPDDLVQVANTIEPVKKIRPDKPHKSEEEVK